MPRKPTIHAHHARRALIDRAAMLPPETSLPSLAVMGDEYDLHPSTVFRILRDLAAEGIYWQSPGGRFFQASERKARIKGAPVCFLGRELWQWSRLYQEMLEGISEVCAANDSPLVVLSSRTLVRQDSPTHAPRFATTPTQSKELAKLIPHIPKGCAGLLLDHMWNEAALKKSEWPGAERVQLLCGSEKSATVIGPDWDKAAQTVAAHLKQSGSTRIALVEPFSGDKAIDLLYRHLKSRLATHSPDLIAFQTHSMSKIHWASYDTIVCPEDNIALEIAQRLPKSGRTRLIGTQGTSILHSPHVRLRIDYRRLGRSAGSYLLHGSQSPPIRAALVKRDET